MRKQGVSAEEVYRIAEEDGLDWFARLGMLQKVYRCSAVEAKEVSLRADGVADTLHEHQERLVPGLKRALEEFEDS